MTSPALMSPRRKTRQQVLDDLEYAESCLDLATEQYERALADLGRAREAQSRASLRLMGCQDALTHSREALADLCGMTLAVESGTTV